MTTPSAKLLRRSNPRGTVESAARVMDHGWPIEESQQRNTLTLASLLCSYRQALRYIIRNTTLPARTRAEAQLQLTQMHAYTRPTQIRNRCILGGKTRGIFRDFKMSRVRSASSPNGCRKCSGCWAGDVPLTDKALPSPTVQLQVAGIGGIHPGCEEGFMVKQIRRWIASGRGACRGRHRVWFWRGGIRTTRGYAGSGQKDRLLTDQKTSRIVASRFGDKQSAACVYNYLYHNTKEVETRPSGYLHFSPRPSHQTVFARLHFVEVRPAARFACLPYSSFFCARLAGLLIFLLLFAQRSETSQIHLTTTWLASFLLVL